MRRIDGAYSVKPIRYSIYEACRGQEYLTRRIESNIKRVK
jgi:hypothetical protein